MSNNYGVPPCPDSAESPRHARMPGAATCPRSDTYRMIENGTIHNIFGWAFRCRTCKLIFFRASREASREGFQAAMVERAAKAAQEQERRR